MNSIRSWLKPETRGMLYTASAAVVTALVVFGVIASNIAAPITAVVLAAITLIYAMVHSESTLRTAAYALCAAVGALMVTLGTVSDDQSDALLAVIAPVLGISLAAAKTPTRSEDGRVDTWVATEV